MRDFFYNKGDVFIAILIILVAAFVIYIRVGVIMDYSATGESGGGLLPMPSALGGADNTGQGADSTAGTGSAAGTDSSAMTGTDTGAGTDQGTDQTADQSTQTQTQTGTDNSAASQDQGAQTQTPPATQPGAPMQIIVSSGDAASTIADKLYAAGAISDKQGFLNEVIAEGADSKLKVGTFTIPAGASFPDIIKILVG